MYIADPIYIYIGSFTCISSRLHADKYVQLLNKLLGKEKIMTNDYMIVLEFGSDDLENYDCVVALETRLEAELESGEIDGHDEGGGVVNVFISTTNPKECFKEAMKIIKDVKTEPDAAGYRR